MKYSECTAAYAVSVIREILDDNPAWEALGMVRDFLADELTVEDALWPGGPAKN